VQDALAIGGPSVVPRAARFAALFLAAVAAPALAQEELAPPIHWAYGAYFGTGHYQVDDGQSAYVLSFRPSYRMRTASLDQDGRRVGIELRFPVAVGTHRFDLSDAGSTLRFDNVNTLSIVPGVELDIPMGARWSLKPFAYVGYGAQLSGDASAWMYWGGLKSRVRLPGKSVDWSLFNSLTYVGYRDDAEHSNVLPLFTAFEFERPLAVRIANEQVRLHWHVGYTSYLNEIDLRPTRSQLRAVTIDDEWEVGAAFSTGEAPLKLWKFKWDRVGVAYRFSSDGDFEGVSLFFRSLFDR
jgi:hypothetical protein